MLGVEDADVPQIKLRALDTLVAYARNARTHSPAQVKQLQGLLLEFGWTNAVLMDEMGIVAGHGRCLAAAEIYKQGKQIKFPNGSPIPIGFVPTLDCTGWSDLQRKAYILADNRSAMAAGWDEELLTLELKELSDAGFDMALTAFEDVEVAAFLAAEIKANTPADPEIIPDVPDVALSVLGDVWVLGAHRIICGDSLDAATWSVLLGSEQADLCITDPPYNVAYVGKTADAMTIKNDKMGDGNFRQFLLDSYLAVIAVMKAGAPIYVAHSDTEGLNFRSAFQEAGFKLSGCLIWRKNSMVLGRSDYQWQHEPILYGWKPGAAHRWYGGRKLTTIVDHGEGGPIQRMEDGRWAIRMGDSTLIVSGEATLEESPSSVIYHDRPSRSELHPTTKPVGLWERLMKSSARAGDIVIDGFSGSGTTILAADRLGMIARVVELDPKFVDVAVRRWEAYTGRRAVHAVTGEQFPCEGGARAVPFSGDDFGADGCIPDGEVF